ncbi:MAG: N-acetylneuraminate synthase [Muribaculaceae bacterium]|nr:N-acetylneuraminate synthase [Muribaculaceae bacterium]
MKHTIIIAEAGVNHNGSYDRAVDMIHAAARAGVDYVKFQTFKSEKLVSASAPRAEYQKRNCGGDDSQLAMLRALELSYADFARLADECRRTGIGFMSTPFDLDSIDFLATLGMDYWKIPSGEITNLPYLRKIALQHGRVILSTGMSTIDEVEAAVSVLEGGGTPRSDVWLLHCTTQYPTPYTDVNLRAMDALLACRCRGVGYSDHTQGIAVPVAAVALGAKIIEKHFTLDKTLPGPDHKASLDVAELTGMVRSVRAVEQALGDGAKRVTDSERPNIAVARKSIVAACDIAAGEIFTERNLTVKRPGTGLSPMLWDTLIGTPSTRAYHPDDQIQ